jgi:hypothetical protein
MIDDNTVPSLSTHCTRCGMAGDVRDFTTWQDEVSGDDRRHCDSCAAITKCGVCHAEGHHSMFHSVIQDGEWIMDVCRAHGVLA